jgi:hypothetical protein
MGDPSFSIRSFIKWKHEPLFNEPTSTWVLTASNNEFVDTRLVLDKSTESKNWFIAGHEEEIKKKDGYLYSIAFIHKLDNFCKAGEEPGKDVGHFKKIEVTPEFKKSINTKDYEQLDFNHHRLEEGFMANPDLNNEIEDYQEIWNTINPWESEANSLIPLIEKTETIHSKVFKRFNSKGEECGRYIAVGKFGMGICLLPNQEYVAIRTFEDKCIFESHSNANDQFHCATNKAEWHLTYED